MERKERGGTLDLKDPVGENVMERIHSNLEGEYGKEYLNKERDGTLSMYRCISV